MSFRRAHDSGTLQIRIIVVYAQKHPILYVFRSQRFDKKNDTINT